MSKSTFTKDMSPKEAKKQVKKVYFHTLIIVALLVLVAGIQVYTAMQSTYWADFAIHIILVLFISLWLCRIVWKSVAWDISSAQLKRSQKAAVSLMNRLETDYADFQKEHEIFLKATQEMFADFQKDHEEFLETKQEMKS